jgi:hypothetical protein
MPIDGDRGQSQYAESDGVVHMLDDIQIPPDEFLSRDGLRSLS